MFSTYEIDNDLFQSTPSVWRETNFQLRRRNSKCISIHSLRMEGDEQVTDDWLSRNPISIHSLRMEGDTAHSFFQIFPMTFQSTPSVWRETTQTQNQTLRKRHFNPLPPYGGRPVLASILRSNTAFQSTPSVWRETHVTVTVSSPSAQFQSTPSVWRETLILRILTGTRNNFNPLPPYGGRQQKQNYRQDVSAFQSTPSVWRETCKLCQYLCASSDFNPLPPYGGRPLATCWLRFVCSISIHSLRMEGDHPDIPDAEGTRHFNPLPPYGGRL